MKVGDLIKEREHPEMGVLIEIRVLPEFLTGEPMTQYGVLCPNGKIQWFGKTFIEEKCEVISESR